MIWARIKRILSIGLTADMTEEDRERAMMTQFISLFFIVIALPYPVIYTIAGVPTLIGLTFSMLALNGLIFYIGASGNFPLARILLLLFLNFSLLQTQSLWGEAISLKYGFFLFMILPLLLYPSQQLKSILLFTLIPLVGFLLLHFDFMYYLDWMVLSPEAVQRLQPYVEVSIAGTFCALLSVLGYDLFRRRKREVKIQRASEKAVQAKSRFYSTISHEIRTPLNSLIGLAELMDNTNLDSEQAEYSRVIKLSAESLMSVVNGVLDYSRIEAQNLELEEVPFALTQTIREVVDILNIRAQKRGYKIQYQIEDSLDRNLKGDPIRLKQILMNIIGNAVKFTFEGGIVVRAEDIGLKDQKQMVRISVRDTGIGIPQDKISQLFDPYKQVKQINEGEGAGLGLAITWELVHLMGGKVWVESEPSRGTTFSVELGFTVLEPSGISTPIAPININRENSQLEILLVEDNPVNQRVVRRMLEKLGFRPDWVADGQAAIEATSKKQYDLILMDLELPVLNGIEATKQILFNCRKRTAKSLCPLIIALTANATVEYQHQCLASGMQDFLTKPVRTKELEKMILNWFPKAKTIEEA
ncbi:MAG: ATP-binding protein [Bacteroidota bacterium]